MTVKSISNQGAADDQLGDLPKTEMLYYDDSYGTFFQGKVLSEIEFDAKRFVILDRTCFFP